ncbi:MAG: phosphoribosyl-ATP diphosphatase [Gemmatimonadetes bacterium]|nr:phosphoribosyl-ATP diphosphatase [Gemmatimonadota bacterium]
MIIPSIDLQNGKAVQLVRGEKLAIDAGDPLPIAEEFGRTGEFAVIDLDAAMGVGENRRIMMRLVKRYGCRVGGGIRTPEEARVWLNAGASKVILGTAADRKTLSQLPTDRVIAALDAVDGEVVVEGWKKGTGETVLQRMQDLAGLVDEFFVTFVEREGMQVGIERNRIRKLDLAAGEAKLTIAGGIRSAEEIGWLDARGIDAQVGMALYTHSITVADALAACLRSDRADGLWPTIVADEAGTVLGLAWSDCESLREAISSGMGFYRSRRRGLWRKGLTSGNTQRLLQVALDCDRDAILFRVKQEGGFCHLGTRNCFGDGWSLTSLRSTIESRALGDAGSFSKKLMADEQFWRSKVREEAREFAEADDRENAVHEAADLLFMMTAGLARYGIEWNEVLGELARRGRAVTRRDGSTVGAFAPEDSK